MPRQIIVMNVNPSDGGHISVTAAFWFAAVGTAVANPTFASAVSPAIAGGQAPTASELSNLRSGAWVEQVLAYQFPTSYSEDQIKAFLVAVFASIDAWRKSQPSPVAFYGLSYDPTVPTLLGWNA